MLNRIPSYYKNFYSILGITFLLWMTFIDSNDLINRFRTYKKLNNLENEREYYLEKIKTVQKDREELLGTMPLLEKFAREKYLMKKPNEDIFIIEEKK